MANPMTPERQSLGQTFEKEGFLSALGQAGQMLIPGSWQNPRGTGIKGLVQDMVEFSPVGDVGDLNAARTGQVDGFKLDFWERALAGFAGVGLVGGALHLNASVRQTMAQKQQLDFQIQAAASARAAREALENTAATMAPPTGQPWQVYETPDEDTSLTETGEERRIRAARYEQLAAELQSEPLAMLRANTFDELTNMIATTTGTTPSVAFNVGTRYIGAQVVARSKPGTYGPVGGDLETQQLVAAKFAYALAYNGAANGRIKYRNFGGSTGPGPWEQLDPEYLTGVLNDRTSLSYTTMALDAVVDLQIKAQEALIGPTLVPTPQTKIVQMELDAHHGTGRLVTAVTVMPDRRMYDPDTTWMTDIDGYYDQIGRMDWDAFTGDFAANIVMENVAQRAEDPKEFKHYVHWYRKANSSAKVIGDWAGRQTASVAAVISALSPQNKWVPDNIVAAFHLVAAYSGKEFNPEYEAKFLEALEPWGRDIFNSTSIEKLKEIFGWTTKEAKAFKLPFVEKSPHVTEVLRYWANPENVRTQATKDAGFGFSDVIKLQSDQNRGYQSGDPNLIGQMTAVKWDAVNMLMQAGINPVVVLRQSKTVDFWDAILSPYAAMAVALDTHSNNTIMGNGYGVEPWASDGTRTLSQDRPAYRNDNRDIQTISLADIEAAKQQLIEAGYSEQRAGELADRLKAVPSDSALYKYDSARRAFALVSRLFPEMGSNVPNQPQAGSWAITRSRKQAASKVAAKITKKLNAGKKVGRHEFADELKENKVVIDPSIIHHAEGVPQFMRGPVGMVADISEDLSIPEPQDLATRNPTPSTKYETGEPVIREQTADGKVAVWADPSIPAVRHLLRHAAPLPWGGAGSYYRMVPRRPKRVREVRQVVKDLTAQTFRNQPIRGEARIWPAAAQPFFAEGAGNIVVAEVDAKSVDHVLAATRNLEGGLEAEVVPYVSYERSGRDGSVTDSRTMLVFRLGDPDVSVKWPITDGLWNALEGMPEVKGLSAYIHGEYWKPPSAEHAYEHVYFDGTNMMSWRTRQDVHTGDTHQFDVYTRKSEAKLLSSSGNNLAKTARTKDEVAALLYAEGDTVFVNGDIGFSFAGEVELDTSGRILKSRVDGEAITDIYIDLNGVVPMVTQQGALGPGVVHASVNRRGQVSELEALSNLDLNGAYDALSASGVDFEGSVAHVGVVGAEAGSLPFNPTVTINTDVGKIRRLTRPPEVIIEDAAAAAEVVGELGYTFKLFSTSNNVNPSQRQTIVSTVAGFFGYRKKVPSAVQRFIKRYGPIPKDILKELSIETAQIGADTRVYALTTWTGPDRMMWLDERRIRTASDPLTVHTLGDGPFLLDAEGSTGLEITIIHEFGHLLHQEMGRRLGMMKNHWFEERVRYAFEQMGSLETGKSVSYYGLTEWREWWAEVFAQVVVDPKNAHPEARRLVEDVWSALQVPRSGINRPNTRGDFRDLVVNWTRSSIPSGRQSTGLSKWHMPPGGTL